MNETLPYSQWKKINVVSKRGRQSKKLEQLYEFKHPRYTDYCFKKARAREPGKRRGLSTNMMNAAFDSIFTDVVLRKEIMKKDYLMKVLEEQTF